MLRYVCQLTHVCPPPSNRFYLANISNSVHDLGTIKLQHELSSLCWDGCNCAIALDVYLICALVRAIKMQHSAGEGVLKANVFVYMIRIIALR